VGAVGEEIGHGGGPRAGKKALMGRGIDRVSRDHIGTSEKGESTENGAAVRRARGPQTERSRHQWETSQQCNSHP